MALGELFWYNCHTYREKFTALCDSSVTSKRGVISRTGDGGCGGVSENWVPESFALSVY